MEDKTGRPSALIRLTGAETHYKQMSQRINEITVRAFKKNVTGYGDWQGGYFRKCSGKSSQEVAFQQRPE